MVAGASTLAEFSDGRFQLGLGVSNAYINKARGNPEWQSPKAKVESYVETLRELRLTAPQITYPLFLAAHGPAMLATARKCTDGANTYLMTLEHTRQARDILGPSPALNVVMFCLVETDPILAREIARLLRHRDAPLALLPRQRLLRKVARRALLVRNRARRREDSFRHLVSGRARRAQSGPLHRGQGRGCRHDAGAGR